MIINEDFHFDVKWKWGSSGYFKVNEDTNSANFDWIGLTVTYDPSASNNPLHGIELGGYNILVIIYLDWWPPHWYVHISGNFYCHLLVDGTWHYNIEP